MKRTALIAILCGLCACQQRTNETACEELNRFAEPGIVLASDELRCTELLEFARTVPHRYGMDFSTWLVTVPAQTTSLLLDVIFALTGTSWTPTSFDREPPVIPCGQGFQVTDEYWNRSVLARIVTRTRPERLYVSLAVDIPPSPGNIATIRVFQDFDCDGTLGVFELTGEFKQGMPVTGWKPLTPAIVPEFDE